MRNQPSVDHVPGGLPDEVVLNKLLVLVQPRLHPGEFGIVADANGWSGTAGTGVGGPTRRARMQVVVQQQVMMIVVMVVMITAVVQVVVRGRILLLLEQGLLLLLLLLIAAGCCCGRLLAVAAAVAAVVLEWQGDTRTRAQRSIEPHCAPLLGGHPALRLFYTAQVQALLIFLVTTTIEATHASTLAHQGLELRLRWKSPFSSGVRVRTSTAVNLPLPPVPLLLLPLQLLLLFALPLFVLVCTLKLKLSHQIQLLPRQFLLFPLVLLPALVYFILHFSPP